MSRWGDISNTKAKRTVEDEIRHILDLASNGRGDKWAIIQIIRLLGWKPPPS